MASIGSSNNASSGDVSLVDFQVMQESAHILKGVKTGAFHCVLRIVTASLPETTVIARPPISLAVVLDRSGSMAGPKLEQSKVALNTLIDNLRPDDRIHIVAYGSHIETIVENGKVEDRERLIRLVNNIRDEGCTNLSGGLERGRDLLQAHKLPGHTRRIMLLSDGLANEGIKDPEGVFALVRSIHERGITTASFGVGDDFDEKMMTGIAEHGRSNYFYIDKAENIPLFIDTALQGLTGLIGTDAVLRLRGKNGCVVEKVWGFSDLVAGARIGDIKQNNKKTLLARVSITPESGESPLEILSYTLTYLPKLRGEKAGDAAPVTLTGVVAVAQTEDEQLIKVREDEVVVALAVQESADADEEAARLLLQGRAKDAMRMKFQQQQVLSDACYADKSGKLAFLAKRSKETSNQIEKEGASAAAAKRMAYNARLQRADSSDHLDQCM